MSDLGRRQRTARQVWAAPGSRHDRLITTLRVVLPGAIGVLAAFLVTAPLTAGGDVSFVLDKNKVEVAGERLKIQAARYSGQDTRGRPFSLTAASAVQRSSAEPIVHLNRLAAEIRMPDGPATLAADTGRYDMDSERVALDGPLRFRGPDGYDLQTRNATVDLRRRTLRSGGAVTGTVPQGTFAADSMRADLTQRTVTLDGNARLRIVPGRPR